MSPLLSPVFMLKPSQQKFIYTCVGSLLPASTTVGIRRRVPTFKKLHFTSRYRESSDESKMVYQKYVAEFLENPWEREYKVKLYDQEGCLVGEVSKGEARRKAFEDDLILVCLDSKSLEQGEDMKDTSQTAMERKTSESPPAKPESESNKTVFSLPLYQLITKKMYKEILETRPKSPKKTLKRDRQIRIFAKIEKGDLDRKILKIVEWLKNGHNVRVNIAIGNLEHQMVKAAEICRVVEESVPSDLGKVAPSSSSNTEKRSMKLTFLSLVRKKKSVAD